MESGFSEAACKEIMKEVLEQTGSVPASPEASLSSAPAPAEPAWTRADLTTCGEESDDSERVVTPQSPLSPSRSGDRFANHSHARAPIAHELISHFTQPGGTKFINTAIAALNPVAADLASAAPGHAIGGNNPVISQNNRLHMLEKP